MDPALGLCPPSSDTDEPAVNQLPPFSALVANLSDRYTNIAAGFGKLMEANCPAIEEADFVMESLTPDVEIIPTAELSTTSDHFMEFPPPLAIPSLVYQDLNEFEKEQFWSDVESLQLESTGVKEAATVLESQLHFVDFIPAAEHSDTSTHILDVQTPMDSSPANQVLFPFELNDIESDILSYPIASIHMAGTSFGDPQPAWNPPSHSSADIGLQNQEPDLDLWKPNRNWTASWNAAPTEEDFSFTKSSAASEWLYQDVPFTRSLGSSTPPPLYPTSLSYWSDTSSATSPTSPSPRSEALSPTIDPQNMATRLPSSEPTDCLPVASSPAPIEDVYTFREESQDAAPSSYLRSQLTKLRVSLPPCPVPVASSSASQSTPVSGTLSVLTSLPYQGSPFPCQGTSLPYQGSPLANPSSAIGSQNEAHEFATWEPTVTQMPSSPAATDVIHTYADPSSPVAPANPSSSRPTPSSLHPSLNSLLHASSSRQTPAPRHPSSPSPSHSSSVLTFPSSANPSIAVSSPLSSDSSCLSPPLPNASLSLPSIPEETDAQPPPATSNTRPKRTKKAKWDCSTCSLSFARPHGLYNHQRSHDQTWLHWCPMCGRAFANAKSVRRHVNEICFKYPFKCGTCAKGFRTQEDVDKHEARMWRTPCQLCRRKLEQRRCVGPKKLCDRCTARGAAGIVAAVQAAAAAGNAVAEAAAAGNVRAGRLRRRRDSL